MTEPTRPVPRIGMRWKLLALFAGAFTVVFVAIAAWVVAFAGNNAQDRLVLQLRQTAQGGAATVDGDQLRQLLTTTAAVPDRDQAFGLDYPDSPLYRSQAEQLMRIRQIVPEANPYSYFREPADQKLYYAVSAGFLLPEQFGITYRVPVADVVGPDTYQRMEQGLLQTTDEPQYTDDYGTWISSFSPIRSGDLELRSAIGVDYPIAYVDQVRAQTRGLVIPALGLAYLVLLVLVLVVSGTVVRPLRRLTEATRRIADGEYDLDVRALVRSRFPDEMDELGESFARMAAKVRAREEHLTREVTRLRVQIDTAQKDQAVREITESDFFGDLTARAAELRRRIRE